MSFLEAVKAAFPDEPDKPTNVTPIRKPDPFAGDPLAPSSNGYLDAALTAELDALRSTQEGSRNARLNEAAFNLGQLIQAGLDQATTVQALEDAAREIGLSVSEIGPTIRSGLAAGAQKPRTIPDRQEGPTTWLPSPVSPAVPPAPWENTPGDPSTAPPAGTSATAAPESSPPQGESSDDLTEADDPRAQHLARLTVQELYQQKARRDAKAQLDAEEHARHFRIPPWRPTLTQELLIPDEPATYRVDSVLPTGGNALLTAQFKAGKTTLVNALARALADNEPFLGRFDVKQPDGRVALFNFEVDDRQYRRWLRDAGIRDTDRVVILNLRGYRLPVTVPHIEDWVSAWLLERDVKVWAVDPFARAFTGNGTSENDNTEVGNFLDTLDVIKNRAGVGELILPTHTGRAVFEKGEERARGATRLDDWADVRWMLTKDDEDVRFFSATGRDVDVDEEKLTFDEATRALHFGGGDRAWEKRKRVADAVVAAVTETPGINVTRLRGAVRATVEKASNDAITAAIEHAASRGQIRVEDGGTGAAVRHYPGGTM